MPNFDKFGKNLQKIQQKVEPCDRKGMSIIVGFTKMTIAKLANLATIHQRSDKKFK